MRDPGEHETNTYDTCHCSTDKQIEYTILSMPSKQQKKAQPTGPDTETGGDDTVTELVPSTSMQGISVEPELQHETLEEPQFEMDPALEAHINELVVWRMQEQQSATQGGAMTERRPVHEMSNGESAESADSQLSGIECIPTKRVTKKRKNQTSAVSSGSDTGFQQGTTTRGPK